MDPKGGSWWIPAVDPGGSHSLILVDPGGGSWWIPVNLLKYDKLESQQYLEEFNVYKAKPIFRFRTNMANFDGNFKGKETNVVCPVCGLHKDLQQLSFECPVLKKEMIITENYESIFTSTITKNLADILVKIVNIRKSLEEAQMCTI